MCTRANVYAISDTSVRKDCSKATRDRSKTNKTLCTGFTNPNAKSLFVFVFFFE